ncbi:MAG: universal stress protein [Anaerolineae bacterium]|nr:MAG: universal stress protein [Anaerolineae bacterium]
MAVRVSHKLKNALEGALAGGGDPATSPLYVFGPFLKLIVVAGVAEITFGASVWLVILTIAVVSAMYRLVMRWVTDGSGGSGLSEEEFGGWAVKVNAAITFIEYTLTFLVSMAAMVTFIADRIPWLNKGLPWLQNRTLLAIALSVFVGWVVNRGPRVAARTFGPATGSVLILLWLMILATIWKRGFHLPPLYLQAFRPPYLGYTLNGYARILAVMTGIEVFANLVAAYEGTPEQKSRKAFNSLLIIMGTTAVTMAIVGPAIFAISDPTDPEVSVFTQAMDELLPDPLPYAGTLVGIAVLMSASAASAQGLQNLSLGLRERHYLPRALGRRNRFGVADKPVWLEVGIVGLCFLLFGTHEETYLAIYAAGVFILLSMTGWAVTKRLVRQVRESFSLNTVLLIAGTTLAAALTTGATVIIFAERFREGAWTYFLFIPLLYAAFTYFRAQMGRPTDEMDYLGMLDAAQLAGFGFGQYATSAGEAGGEDPALEVTWQPEPKERSTWRQEQVDIRRVVVLLDGSDNAAQALPIAKAICQAVNAHLHLLSSVKNHTPALREQFEATRQKRAAYLAGVTDALRGDGFDVNYAVRPGFIADATLAYVTEQDIDLIITTTQGKSGEKHWGTGGVSRKLAQRTTRPILLVQCTDGEGEKATPPTLRRILIALDGSLRSERVLPYARLLAQAFHSELELLGVPDVPDFKEYRAPAEFIQILRKRKEANMRKFLNAVARSLRRDGVKVHTTVTGSMPARTILEISEEKDVDLIMLTARGRGGLKLLFLGSVAEQVIRESKRPVFVVPTPETNNNHQQDTQSG